MQSSGPRRELFTSLVGIAPLRDGKTVCENCLVKNMNLDS